MRGALGCVVLVALLAGACAGDDAATPDAGAGECGGCSLPPYCPAEPSPCSCGCGTVGEYFSGGSVEGICTASGCVERAARDGGTDGSAADGAVPDGAATDAASDAGSAAGDCSDALLCDDFEDYDVGGAPGGPWEVSTNRGEVQIDEARAYSGARSVRVTTEGGDGSYRRAYFSVAGAPVFPVAGNVVWGRMMMWLESAPTGSIHWTHIQGEGPVEGRSFRGMYRYGGQHDGRLMANYETQGASTDCWQHSATVVPTGRWACMEWQLDGPNDTMRFWLDGAPLDDLTVEGRGEGCIGNDTGGDWLAPTFDTMRLGWERYQTSDARQLWIDDVALDDERIGCP